MVCLVWRSEDKLHQSTKDNKITFDNDTNRRLLEPLTRGERGTIQLDLVCTHGTEIHRHLSKRILANTLC